MDITKANFPTAYRSSIILFVTKRQQIGFNYFFIF